MAIEGINGGSYEEQKESGLMSESFHLDPNKGIDPIEKLLEKLGPEGAFDELMDKLNQSPNDEETRRQANLLVNRLDDLSSRLKGKISH